MSQTRWVYLATRYGWLKEERSRINGYSTVGWSSLSCLSGWFWGIWDEWGRRKRGYGKNKLVFISHHHFPWWTVLLFWIQIMSVNNLRPSAFSHSIKLYERSIRTNIADVALLFLLSTQSIPGYLLDPFSKRKMHFLHRLPFQFFNVTTIFPFGYTLLMYVFMGTSSNLVFIHL